MKHGSNTTRESVVWPGRYGYRWVCPHVGRVGTIGCRETSKTRLRITTSSSLTNFSKRRSSQSTDKQKIKVRQRDLRTKHPGIWEPQISQFTRAVKDLLYNYAETVMWHASGSWANLTKGQRANRLLDRFTKNWTLKVEEGSRHADLEHRELREARLRKT